MSLIGCSSNSLLVRIRESIDWFKANESSLVSALMDFAVLSRDVRAQSTTNRISMSLCASKRKNEPKPKTAMISGILRLIASISFSILFMEIPVVISVKCSVNLF